MPQPSELQRTETELYDDLSTFNTPQQGSDILIGLGLTHMRMHDFVKATQELWAGMHAQTGLQNLATVSLIAGYFANAGVDPATREHFETLHRNQNS